MRNPGAKDGIVCALLVAGLLTGCVKARTLRYYTLSIPPPVNQATGQPLPVTVVVGRLNAPHLLRDDRVVYAMSDVELGVDEYHRWSEPPTGMIERLLVERLRGSGQYKAVQHLSSTTRVEGWNFTFPPWPPTAIPAEVF